MHISDWLPTFGHIAGFNISSTIDGHDMWETMSSNLKSPRQEVLLNIDQTVPYSSYIYDQWKYVNGTTSNGQYDGRISKYGVSKSPVLTQYGKAIMSSVTGKALSVYKLPEKQFNEKSIEILRKQATLSCKNNNNLEIGQKSSIWNCNPLKSPCLFNLLDDPCEEFNLANLYPNILNTMEKRINELDIISVPPRNAAPDWRADPIFYNNTWTWWYDIIDAEKLGIILPY